MPETPGRTSEVRNWLQVLMIVVGIGVGIWEFAVKEIWAPKAAPINLTTDVTVTEAGFRRASGGDGEKHFEAIHLIVTAKNPSKRDLYLLTSCWHAQGLAILTREGSKDWQDAATEAINQHEPSSEGAFSKLDDSKALVVAAGEVFREDQVLHPDESISASFVFYVPHGVYDLLRVHVELPTTGVAGSAEAVWTVKPDKGCDQHLHRMKNGVRGAEITDLYAAFLDRTLQLQAATTTRELSLWQASLAPAATTAPRGASRGR